MVSAKPDRQKAAEIVCDVGGTIVGRTRLQKVGYLLELAGLGDGFHFEYKHYGPYSEELAEGVRLARAFGLVEEQERPTGWGGFYSIYTVQSEAEIQGSKKRAEFAREAAGISAIELELLATAAYLHVEENCEDPWSETKRRKPEKARDRLERAKSAYRKLQEIKTPRRLPEIA